MTSRRKGAVTLCNFLCNVEKSFASCSDRVARFNTSFLSATAAKTFFYVAVQVAEKTARCNKERTFLTSFRKSSPK